MKSVITLMITFFSVSTFAEMKIEKFELLKVLDGKHQKCESKADYYKPATYKFVTLYTNQPVIDGKVEMFSVFMGQYCHEYKVSGNSRYGYIWLMHDLFKEYNYPVYVEGKDEFVTVIPKNQTIVITDRSYKILKEYKAEADPAGAISEQLEFDLVAGILPEHLADFESGKAVKSALFVFIRQHETRTNSYDDNVTKFISSGPASSLVFTIKK